MNIQATGLQSMMLRIASINERIYQITNWSRLASVQRLTSQANLYQTNKSQPSTSFSNILAKTAAPKVIDQINRFALNETDNNTSVKNDNQSSQVSNVTKNNAKISQKDMINNIINEAAKRFKLDPALLKAMIKQESNYNPNAVSSAGAQGLMQLMPQTAKALGVANPFDIKQNIMGGAKYISELSTKYKDLNKALAAYNAGPGNVEKYNGIPPFKETINYIKKINQYMGNHYNIAKAAYKKQMNAA
jgi:soluble lytic murein transglycosylase-like protein